MQWWAVYVQVPEYADEMISGYLQDLGSPGVVIHEETVLSPGGDICLESRARGTGWTVLHGALPLDATLPVRLCALQQFLDTCPTHSSKPPWKLYGRLVQEAYCTQWRHFFRPLQIAQRLVIRPPWDTTTVSLHMASLVLDPGLAFGTGLHPTTRLCLTLLAQGLTSEPGACLLDVGCGSGILSLAGLKLGMQAAVGVDIDAQAVQVARRNAALNALQDRAYFLQGSVAALRGRFDCIAANIYLEPLIHMMPAFARCLQPQGRVILSGVLVQQETALQASLQAVGLHVQQRAVEAEWLALEARLPLAMPG
ncbi:Ribosomal protein L11 methyltransferase [Candidatus Entotheonellaceae bacterium PAL068K]